MVGPLTLYAVLVAGMVVFFAAAYVYYESQTAVGRPFRKRGVTPTGLTVAVVLTLSTVVALWLLGSTEVLHPEADLRVVGVRVLAISFPLVVGLVGLNAGYTLARRWRRLHPDNDVPTGDLAPGTVACTGTVTTAATGAGPVTGREAVCWSWSVEVQNPHGDPTTQPARQSTTVDGGDGGVVFTVDDGSGPVAVDPSDATLDLVSTRSLSFDADSGPDIDFPNPAPKVERTHDDKARTYEESIAAPGDPVALAGTATRKDRGLVVGGPDAHVAVGSLATVSNRYRTSAAAYVTAGLVGVAIGLWLQSTYFGVL